MEERSPKLGPLVGRVELAGRRPRRAVRDHPSGGVRDHHALVAGARALRHESLEPRRAAARQRDDEIGDAGGEDRGVSEDGGLVVRLGASLDGQRERNRERENGRGREVEGGEEEPRSEAHVPAFSSSADAKRKPTPRTVWMKRGADGSSPSFLRSALTCTSSVFVEPNQLVSQTSRIELLAPNDLAGVLEQHAQHLELLDRQLDGRRRRT